MQQKENGTWEGYIQDPRADHQVGTQIVFFSIDVSMERHYNVFCLGFWQIISFIFFESYCAGRHWSIILRSSRYFHLRIVHRNDDSKSHP